MNLETGIGTSFREGIAVVSSDFHSKNPKKNARHIDIFEILMDYKKL
jgi:hypothetical protein